MSFSHMVPWLDHAETHIFSFNADTSESETLRAHQRHPRHYKASDKHADSQYFSEIAATLRHALEILVAGPAQEKIAFAKHMEQRFPAISKKIIGVETVDHPTDPQLLAYARKHFLRADIFR
jgi:stalled ribosome rescue protein Dom34